MRSTILTVVLLATLALAPAARADFQLVEPRTTAFATDGERFAVAARPDGSLAVLDDERSVRELAAPACTDPAVRARLSGVGGGLVAFDCTPEGRPADARLVELATGRVIVPAGLEQVSRYWGGWPSVGAVGRRYLGLSFRNERGDASTVYLDWRTGTWKQDTVIDARRAVMPDLDLPGLDRRLCAPLRRTIVKEPTFSGLGEEDAYARFEYRDRHLLRGRRLYRCGEERPRVLRRAEEFGTYLAPGRVVWREGATLVLDPFRRGARTVRVAMPSATGAVAQTRRHLFFLPWSGEPSLSVARVPRR